MKFQYLVAACVALTLTFSSCSKDRAEKTGGASGASLFEAAILDRLPAATTGFVVMRFEGPAYERYQKTPYGSPTASMAPIELSDILKDGPYEKEGQLLQALKESGIFTGGKEQDFKQAAIFFANQVGGIVLEVSDAKKKLQTLTSQLAAKGISATAEKIEGFDALAISNENASISILGDQDLLVATPSKELAVKILKRQEVGTSALRATDAYKRAVHNLNSGDEIIAAYLDIAKATEAVLPHLENLAASKGEPIKLSSSNNPFVAAAYARSMGVELKDRGQLVVEPKEEGHKSFLSSLETGNRSTLFNRVPPDAVVAITLDGALLQNFIKEAGPVAAASTGLSPETLASIGGLAVGVRNAGPTSAFPEIFLLFRTSKAAELQAGIKDNIGKTLASQMQTMPTWQKKALNGGEIEYFLTPLGIGAFIGTLGDSVVLTTSESAIQAAFNAGGSAAASLQGALAAKGSGAGSASGIVAAYADMPKLAVLIESVQGNLAMFTGGRSAIDTNRTAAMRDLGGTALGIEVKERLVKFEAQHLIGVPTK